MRTLATLLLLSVLMAATISAMLPPPPPPTFVDLYGEDYHPRVGWRENTGWVIDTDGSLRPDVRAKSEGTPFGIWPRENSTVTFTWRTSGGLLHRVDVRTIGELANLAAPIFRDVKPGHHNYYYPHTAPNGAEGVLAYNRVDYLEIYPDIDMILYSGSGGPKLAYVVRPGGDPANILLQFQGQDSLKVDSIDGELRMYLDSTHLLLPYVIAYQWDVNNIVDTVGWTATFRESTSGDMISFDFDTYDTNEPLVFLIGAPPAAGGGGGPNGNMDWSTLIGDYSGGAGAPIMAAETHTDGDLLVTGFTNESAYPANTGSTPHAGGRDCFTGRYLYAHGNSSDDARNEWVTFLGGNYNDFGYALAYDSIADMVVVGGFTNSADLDPLPAADPNDGTYWQGTNKGGFDGLLARFAAFNGVRERVTYFGGEGDEMVTGVAVDSDGNTYLTGATNTATGGSGTGCTASATGFPVCDIGGYFAGNNSGSRDAFVARLDAGHQLRWSTFYGTATPNVATGIAINEVSGMPSARRVVVVGMTTNSMATTGPTGSFQAPGFLNGIGNGFIASFTDDGQLHWATNVPRLVNGLEDLAVSKGRLVVVGAGSSGTQACQAVGDTLPLCDPGSGAYFRSIAEYSDQYIAEFEMSSGTLSWSTFVGGETLDGMNMTSLWPEFTVFPFVLVSTMDVEFDDNYNLFMSGTSTQHINSILAYPAQGAAGWYDQPYNVNSGLNQVEVALNAFLADRTKYWTSHLGISFDHVDSIFDMFYGTAFMDFPLGLAISDGNALYVVGTSGAFADWPAQCPYPGVSYCEPAFDTDSDGFISRFNLNGSMVGIEQGSAGLLTGQLLYPNPASDMVTIAGTVPAGTTFVVHDALGRVVLRNELVQNSFDALSLVTGTYAVHLLGKDGARQLVGRFIKQ